MTSSRRRSGWGSLVPRGCAPAPAGCPTAVGGTAVDSIREDWVVEDRWWNGRPVRRRYFELVLADGRNVVVFHDLRGGRWLLQRA